MTTFDGIQFGALKAQEFRTEPVPFWLVWFLGGDQGSDAPNVLRCRAAERNCC
jgi:hypothetical protein